MEEKKVFFDAFLEIRKSACAEVEGKLSVHMNTETKKTPPLAVTRDGAWMESRRDVRVRLPLWDRHDPPKNKTVLFFTAPLFSRENRTTHF